MRYKVVKREVLIDYVPTDRYYVMKEVKRWYHRKPIWKYCKEFTYASYDTWNGERVVRNTLKEAEEYIKKRMKADNHNSEPQDIKVYECRSSKIDKVLNS